MNASIEQWLDARAVDSKARSRLSVGAVVGEWRVEAFVGSGLSAEVYRVRNVRYGQEGALKLLTDGSRGLKERFLTEADALRFLSLVSLPRFMGAGVYASAPYYVMEYLQPLPEPMPRREIPKFMSGVAKAVQTLHEAGYIHRDLKPGNILRRRNGEPVLIDLGLVKRRGTAVTDPIVRLGRTVSIIDGKPVGVGTLDYAAPEQLLKGESSVQSDIFALGKILRALYEGHPPASMKAVIRRATRELPADRYPSANDFASAIRHRNRLRIVLLAVAALLPVIVATYPLFRPRLTPVLVSIAAKYVKNQEREQMPLTPQPNEADSAYLCRIRNLATDGNVAAQVCIAEAYFYGRGVATNRTESVRWYRKAASAGEPSAQASLGLCCLRGWGCPKDQREAVRWYRRAAEQGNLMAMNDLAFCLMHGIGVDGEPDPKAGFAWALKAAERGHAPAQTLVGECYLEGRGVERDLGLGEMWLYRAARLGNRRAQKLLEGN